MSESKRTSVVFQSPSEVIINLPWHAIEALKVGLRDSLSNELVDGSRELEPIREVMRGWDVTLGSKKGWTTFRCRMNPSAHQPVVTSCRAYRRATTQPKNLRSQMPTVCRPASTHIGPVRPPEDAVKKTHRRLGISNLPRVMGTRFDLTE
jgi:hypothetical protein